MKRHFFLGVGLFLCATLSQLEAITPENLIPTPAHIVKNKNSFTLPKTVSISVSDKSLMPAAQYLQKSWQANVNVLLSGSKSPFIYLQLTQNAAETPGAYTLDIKKNKITLTSGSYEGFINGISTLRQLTALQKTPVSLPIITIKDSPRFAWRGLHLDASRHFMDKNEVKEVLNLMALYKLNKMHWHLTDDQGWRIEIKKYPLLTEKSAWRHFNSQDRDCMRQAKKQDNPDFLIPEKFLKINGTDTLYGGFYTQADIREVVAYAKNIGIEIIPEIDMPGHSMAAIDAYNGLVCGGKYGWGNVFSSPLCPGKDAVMEFCKSVYAEVFDLFPSKYVHIGGDEVDKHNWKGCADCQKRIKNEQLKNEEELQAWFIREMEKYFNKNGKTLIGWDEVLNDGLNSSSVIMWWRTWVPDAPIQAEKQGKKSILCPGEYFYFDANEDSYSVPKMLAYEPTVTKKGSVKESSILGVQACLWSEGIPSLRKLQYMLVPRLFALSELAWAMPDRKMKIDEYRRRSPHHFRLMESKGINYRVPDAEGYYDTNVFTDKITTNIRPALNGITIRYTTDGTHPTAASPELKAGTTFDKTTRVKLRQFRPDGTADNIVSATFLKTEFSNAVSPEPITEQGLNAYISTYKGNTCDSIGYFEVKNIVPLPNVQLPEKPAADFSMILKGYIYVPADDIYTFALLSDDGSLLIIDNQTVIDNNGLHSPFEKTGQTALRKGWHTLEIPYFDKSGGTLRLQWLREGKWQKIPDAWLRKR